MKKINKYVAVSVIAAVLIAAFSFILIAYDRGVFELPFIKRFDTDTAPQGTTTEPYGPEEPGTGTGDQTDETDENITTGQSGEDPSQFDVFDKLHDTYKTVAGRDITATEETFDPETMTLWRLDNVTLPYKDNSDDIVIRTKYLMSVKDGLRVYTAMAVPEIRRAADVYMGLLVVSDNGKLTLYDGSGKPVLTYEGEEPLRFPYERDEENRPLFMIGDAYYVIEDGQLVESGYDARDNRGLYFNYPASFGRAPDQYRPFRSGDLYGIRDTDGDRLRSAIYKEAYGYSEGLGLVNYPITKSGVLTDDYNYLNENGKVVIENFYPVGAKDEGGIGAIYFDGGYVMVRSIKYHPLKKPPVVEEDREIIIDTRGREFELPEGYEVVNYSDQRILVKHNGKYGFYAVKGAWITDAVYTYAKPYYEGLAVVGDAREKGVIDMDGNFVIPPSYSQISVCSGGIIVCWSDYTGYEVYIKAAK